MRRMNYRNIPQHPDTKLSEISLGCWTMSGLNWQEGRPNGWADVDEDEVVRAVKRAVDAGVNHFDNADVYGNGRAERMLARVFRKLGLKSGDFIVATKVGHLRGSAPHAFDPFHIRRQCEQSLRNLERDYIDIYYFHHGNFGPNNEYLDDAAEAMERLVKEGKVRIKGQSAYSDEDFLKTVPVVKPAVLQGRAHARDLRFIRKGSPVSTLMEENNLVYVGFSPLAQATLLDKYDPENPPDFQPGDNRYQNPAFSPDNLRDVRASLKKIKDRFGFRTEDLAAVALRYILNHPHVACVIPGFRNERQVACNLAGADLQLSDEDMAFIRAAHGKD